MSVLTHRMDETSRRLLDSILISARKVQAVSCSLLVLAALSVAARPANASEWNKLTRLNVHETIQVPGAVLPPGHYVVKLADSPANRHIVQFFNEDQSKLYSTVLAISDQRMSDEVTGDTELLFYETRGNEPPALRAWFYPGTMIGQEFVYPKSESQIIAKNSGRSIPTVDDKFQTELKTRGNQSSVPDVSSDTRIYNWSSEGKEVPQAESKVQSSRMDREQKWRDLQKSNRRYGDFDVIVVAPLTSNYLPVQASKRSADIKKIVERLEAHSDAFEKQFKEALNSSTVRIADRDDLKSTVDRLEDRLDNLKKEYDANGFKEAHAELMRALEVATSVNRIMLRSEFGSAEPAWSVVRDDLNTLAAIHQIPAIEVYAITAAAKR